MSATFSILLKADPRGVQTGTAEAVAELKKVESAALKANSAIRSIFGFYAIKEAVKWVYDLSNGYQTMSNKLRILAKDQSNLNGLVEGTYKSAEKSRSSWDATTMVFQRMSLATKGLGVTQREVLDFTTKLNQVSVVYGSTNKEITSGLIQLSQGLAAGSLHGQDLRAVLEDVPGVADVIARHLHVTRGELRNMGKDAKITTKVVFDAFKEFGPEIQAAFDKTIPTMQQSFQLLRNAAEKFFGTDGTNSGMFANISRGIAFVSKHFETFGRIAIAVVEELAGFIIIEKITKWAKTLFTLVQTNPLGVLLIALTTGILLLRQFGDSMKTTEKATNGLAALAGMAVTVGDHLRALWDVIKKLADVVGGALVEAFTTIQNLFTGGIGTGNVNNDFASMIDTIAKWVITVTQLIKNAKTLFLDIFGGVPIILAAKFDEAFKGVLDSIVGFINKVIDKINFLTNLGSGIGDWARYHTNYNRNMEAWIKENPGETVTQKVRDNVSSYTQYEMYAPKNPGEKAGSSNYGIPHLSVDHTALAKAGDEARQQVGEDSMKILADINNAVSAYKVATSQHDMSGDLNNNRDKGKQPVDPNAGREVDRLTLKLAGLVKKSNQVTNALEQIREAEVLLSDPRAEGILEKTFGTTAVKVLDDLRAKLHDNIFVYDAWVKKTKDVTAAMHGSSEEERQATSVRTTLDEIRKKGHELTDSEISQIEILTAAEEHRRAVWEQEKNILDNLSGATTRYYNSLEALGNLKGQLSPQDYARQFQNITNAYSSSNDAAYKEWQKKMEKIDPFGTGWDAGIQKITDDMAKLSTTIADTMMMAFSNLENFITSSAESGRVQWSSLITGMEHELNTLALKILENYILMSLLSGGGSDASGVPSVASLKSVFGTGPGGGVAQPTYGGAHAYGGSYTAPGSGAPDSVPVWFHMTPGETANFVPPGSTARTTLGPKGEGPGPRPIIKIVNTIDDRALIDVSDTPYGRTVIANSYRKAGKV